MNHFHLPEPLASIIGDFTPEQAFWFLQPDSILLRKRKFKLKDMQPDASQKAQFLRDWVNTTNHFAKGINPAQQKAFYANCRKPGTWEYAALMGLVDDEFQKHYARANADIPGSESNSRRKAWCALILDAYQRDAACYEDHSDTPVPVLKAEEYKARDACHICQKLTVYIYNFKHSLYAPTLRDLIGACAIGWHIDQLKFAYALNLWLPWTPLAPQEPSGLPVAESQEVTS